MLFLSKKKRFTRIACFFLAINIFFEVISPTVAMALTSGPAQEEFASFEPASTSDMVDLYSGDFTYNIPLLSVPGPNGGYPINVAYHSGIGMEQEASWVGLGWSLNVGAINRQLRGLPDDFNGDLVKKRQHIKESWAVALDIPTKSYKEMVGMPSSGSPWQDHFQVYYNNYKGLGYRYAMNFAFPNKGHDENASIGLNVAFDSQNGTDIEPKFSLNAGLGKSGFNAGFDAGLSYNSRQGLQKLNFATSLKYTGGTSKITGKDKEGKKDEGKVGFNSGTASSSSNVSYAFNSGVPGVSVPMKTTTVPFNLKIAKPSYMNSPFLFKAKFPLLWSGYVTTSKLVDEGASTHLAMGYLHNTATGSDGVMRDFQRDAIPYSKKVPNLAPSAFTYDIFSQTGQGSGSVFRAYQNQINIVKEQEVINDESSYDLEAELGVGVGTSTVSGNTANLHVGLAFNYGKGQNRSGGWIKIKSGDDVGPALRTLSLTVGSSSDYAYEDSYFKLNGEKTGFYSQSSNEDQLNSYGGDDAVRLKIVKEKNDQNFLNRHYIATDDLIRIEGGSNVASVGSQTNRNNNTREKRATNIEYFTHTDAGTRGYSRNLTYQSGGSTINKFSVTRPGNHISEVSMLQPDGMRYVYGLPVYNNKQVDNVFSYKYNSGQAAGDHNTNTVPIHTGSIEGIDIKGTYEEFMSRNELPAYPNSWLLSYIFSADYVDLTNDGPTDDDYGYWVKFNYKKVCSDYKWRAPYSEANFIEGLKGEPNDDKASYTFGEKEIFLLTSIETKTHLAKFQTSDRQDAVEANSELVGGIGTNKLQKLDKIILYTKKELAANPITPTPVKAVNFVYSYELCKGIPNNTGTSDNTNPYYDEFGVFNSGTGINPGSGGKFGKLTLEQIYFTYKNSTRSQLSPYIFKYASGSSGNPDYNKRNMDRWGNYVNNGAYGSGIYPYTDNPYTPQDPGYYGPGALEAGQWSLKQILLPTGGTMNIDYDFDDYYYEETEKACRMYDITGIGTNLLGTRTGTAYQGDLQNHRLYFKLEKPIPVSGTAVSDFKKQYIDPLPKGQVYFKVLAEVKGKTSASSKWDYVSGYADIDLTSGAYGLASSSSGPYDYGYVTLQKVPLSKVNVSGTLINPITRAVIEHLRINRSEILHDPVPYSTSAVAQISNLMGSFFSAFTDIVSAVQGFNSWVYNSVYNHSFNVKLNGRSIIRLCDPDNKIGGGVRVKRLTLDDNWKNGSTTDNSSYGQEYDYTTTAADGSVISSGIAYEPQVGSEESALRTALKYTNSSLLFSDYHTFVETPIAKIHYPGESVGYSKVTVRSIGAGEAFTASSGSTVIQSSAAPITQYEFYTPKDFPVIFKQTDNGPYSKPIFIPIPVLGLFTQMKRRQAKSQGYTVILNDMAGKPKATTVYTAKNSGGGSTLASEPDQIISRQSFVYSTVSPYNPNAKNELLNKVQAISVDNSYNTTYKTAILGQSHDMYIDMHENSQEHNSFGFTSNFDLAVFNVPIYVLMGMWMLPSYHKTTNNMRTVVFNKVIQRSGILTKVETTTDKSTIVQENLAFDIETGQPVLTKVTNEFKDPIYNFSYPGHWFYSNVGPAYKNFGVKVIGATSNSNGTIPIGSANTYFTKGDLVWVNSATNAGLYHVFTLTNTEIHCVNSSGVYFPGGVSVTDVTVVKSGYKNQQNLKVGSLTFKRFKNAGSGSPEFVAFDPQNAGSTEFTSSQPLTLDSPTDNKILNASAIELTDNWQMACGVSYTALGAPTTTCSPPHGAFYAYMQFLQGLNSTSNLLSHNLPVVINGASLGYSSSSPIPVSFSNGFNSTLYNNYPALQGFVQGFTTPYVSTGKNVYYSGYISPATYNLIVFFSDGVNPVTTTDINSMCSQMSTITSAGVSLSPNLTFELPAGVSISNMTQAATFWSAFINASASAVSVNHNVTLAGGWVNCTDVVTSSSVPTYGTLTTTLACRPTCVSVSGTGPLNNIPCPTCINFDSCYTVQPVVSSVCGTNPNSPLVIDPYQNGMKGIWRTKYSYAYKTERDQSNNNIREDGTFAAYNRFPWENPSTKDPKWIKSNTISKYLPEGFEIENVNPIGNFSSALYGYDNALSTAVANNARYNDIGFDGFEDYPKACDEDHFSYSNYSANVTNAASHTGKYSINVPALGAVTVYRTVFNNCDANTVNGVPYVNDNPASINTSGGQNVAHVVSSCDCIGKFAPQPSKDYIFSAWVSQKLSSNPSGVIPYTYTGVEGRVTFYNGTTAIGTVPFTPSGNIIDGWQRITGKFTVPSGATSIGVSLVYYANYANTTVYFDDVRVQPADANMKAYVYDNLSLKVLAELDENNYATIYNYDEEGHLTKVKRETEQGVKTVQEGRINSKKVKN